MTGGGGSGGGGDDGEEWEVQKGTSVLPRIGGEEKSNPRFG